MRVTRIAVNRLTNTPIASVSAKPLTMLAPNALPNQYRMPQVISVEIFESRIDGQAAARSQFFLHTLEDQDVGVNSYTDRQDETGDAGQRQRNGNQLK